MVYSNLNIDIKYISPDELIIENNGTYDHLFVARTGHVGYIQLIFQPSIDLPMQPYDYLVYTIPDGYRPCYYHKTCIVFNYGEGSDVMYSGTTTIYENGNVYIFSLCGFKKDSWIWVSTSYIC